MLRPYGLILLLVLSIEPVIAVERGMNSGDIENSMIEELFNRLQSGSIDNEFLNSLSGFLSGNGAIENTVCGLLKGAIENREVGLL